MKSNRLTISRTCFVSLCILFGLFLENELYECHDISMPVEYNTIVARATTKELKARVRHVLIEAYVATKHETTT
jgi:hypothetical protein